MTAPFRPRKLSVAEMLMGGDLDTSDPLALVRRFAQPVDTQRPEPRPENIIRPRINMEAAKSAGLGLLKAFAGTEDVKDFVKAHAEGNAGEAVKSGALAALAVTPVGIPERFLGKLKGPLKKLVSTLREEQALKGAAGATLNAATLKPAKVSGFMVGSLSKAIGPELTEEAVAKAVGKVGKNDHLGIWFDPEAKVWYAEPSTLVADREAALKLGAKRKQKAIGELSGGSYKGDVRVPQPVEVSIVRKPGSTPNAFQLDAGDTQAHIIVEDGVAHVLSLETKGDAGALGPRAIKEMQAEAEKKLAAEGLPVKSWEGYRVTGARYGPAREGTRSGADDILSVPATPGPFVSKLTRKARGLMDVLTPAQQKLIQAGNTAVQSEHLNRYAAHMDPEAYEAAVRAGSPLAGWYKQLRDQSRLVVPDPNENALLQLVGAGFSTQNPPSREMVSALKTFEAARKGKTPGQAYRAGIGSKKSLLAQEMNVLRVLEAAREGKPLNPFEILSGPKVQNYAGSRLPPEVAEQLGLDPNSFAAMDLHETRLEQLPQQYVSGRNEGGRGVQDARYLGPLAMRRTLANKLGMPTPDVQSSGWHFAQGSMDELGRRAHLKLYGKPQDAGLPLIKNPRGRKAIKTLGPEWAVQEMERIADSFGPENLRGMQTPSEYFGKPREDLLPALAPGDPDALRRAARNVVLSAFDQYRLPAIAALTAGLPFAAAQREAR